MRAMILISGWIIALVGVVCVPSAQSTKSVKLRGRVVNLFGTPIADASIEASADGGGETLKASTDAQGNYEINGLPAGRIKVFARAYGSEREEFFIAVQPGEQRLLDFGLE